VLLNTERNILLKKINVFWVAAYFCLGVMFCSAQNTVLVNDSILAEARSLKDLQKFEEAINLYSIKINQSPAAGESYLERAFCLEKLNRYDEAIKDYQIYVALNPNSIEARKKILIDYLMIENYGFANEAFVTLTNEINKLTSAYQKSAIEKIQAGNIEGASKDINLAIDNNKNDEQSWFLKGIIMDSLHNYQAAAQHYIKAISCMFASREYKEAKDRKHYKSYFINLAVSQRKLMANDEAMKNINTALTYDDSDAVIYRERAILYAEKNEIANAENDFNKAISLDNRDAKTFYERGNFKKENSKIQDAVGDYTNAILLNDKFKEAYVQRAWCYEHLNKFTEAKKEFARVKELGYDKKLIDEKMQTIKTKEYEYNKETNNPEIELTAKNTTAEANTIRIAKSKKESVIKGIAKDQSEIKSITIDGVDAKFDTQTNNPSFSANVPIENKETLKLQVTDVYNNTSSKTIKIERTEDTPPKIFLTTPYINLTKEIIPEDPKQKSIYLEGKIEDESLIGSISINGKKIEFNGENTNPTFNYTLDIEKIDSLVIVAVDIYENSKQIFLNINRKLAEEEATNPMGRTLIVLVENSNYQNLSALEGTSKDVSLLKSSFANYNISKIIHKQNMNKAQMEKFFAIELRDMINKGNVKSLMIWYAGHGKYVNETGYWVPVDANKTDEFTYFPVTNLKGYLSRYKLDHTLIVSDACEAGTSFYLAMRGETKPLSCSDWEKVKLKSAQVLTSSDREGALDNSTFAKTFSNVLKYAPDHCISIDKITEKVTSTAATSQPAAQRQKPKFGIISGLEHQDGTFFFVKK
jgi:tetratricopeptide (TPR) repeat protein